MLCALIMAGGKGERFWPLSTDEKPKQFLKLLSEETMLQMTVNRIRDLIPVEQIFIVTAQKYVGLVKEQISDIPERNIIVEPVGKNTAPCIALSAFVINNYYKDAVVAILPSDHLIGDKKSFLKSLVNGYKFVLNNNDAIVTIGMKPDRPDTGYGYIKVRKENKVVPADHIRRVEKFVEKPDLETAKLYLEEGNYLWNGGMFIWSVSSIFNLNKKYLPENYTILSQIAATSEEDFDRVLDEKYKDLDNISVDYGIMEKAEKIYVLPGDFGWDDVGTWYSVERVREKDKDGNVVSGEVTNIDGKNNLVVSSSKPIVVIGMENLFIVESDERIFISSKKSIDNIKEIKREIG